MKRSFLILIVFPFISTFLYGQVETNYFPKRDAWNHVKIIKDHPIATTIKTFPSFDFQEYLNRDKENEKKGLDVPLRFGKAFETNFPLSDGEWITLSNGRLWSMKFRSTGAYSINFVFENLYLPESSWLYIINSEGTMLYGPVTSKQNTNGELFLTDLIKGDEVTIYLYESNSEKGKSKLSITT